MRMTDLIISKRDGKALSEQEIAFFVRGCTSGEIPDYQAAALLMAIYFQGMNAKETALLTDYMARSGDMVDLSAIPGIKVDKHSTGGVGDKTSMVIGPIVAACGVPVAKMSGRGLGHTGGTLDKLESIPGMRVDISTQQFFDLVRQNRLSIMGQTGSLAPADKKLYALRDVTGTVENLSLIASSIMSKKLAAGSDAILLDVKTGSGAFMKTLEDSVALAQAMVSIGEHMGRSTLALITDMDIPLGYAIGNSLEVMEAVDTLRGRGPKDFTEVCMQLAANMLFLAQKGSIEHCRSLAEEAIATGKALQTFKTMVAAQGGDTAVLDDFSRFPKAAISSELLASAEGFVSAIQTEQCGLASVALGAGRAAKEDAIDYSAGILLNKKVGEPVKKGEVLATLFTNNQQALPQATRMLQDAFSLSLQQPKLGKLVYARVTAEDVTYF